MTQTVSESGASDDDTDGEATDTDTDTDTNTDTDTDTDTSTPPACGDGVVDEGEECDGSDLDGLTCADLGFSGGMLACDDACALDVSGCSNEAPSVPSLSLSFSAIKQFDFSWAPVADADYYRLEQRATYVDPFIPVSGDIVGTSFSMIVPLHFRHESSYRLLACNEAGCTNSVPLGVMGSLEEAVGYVKATYSEFGDEFGQNVALSADGTTLVVTTTLEDGGAIGINGNGANNLAPSAGAAYVYVRDDSGAWALQAYVKASNTEGSDAFGASVALSADGNTLAVGASGEDGGATGIDGDQNNAATGAGAVYVYVRDAMGVWTQQAYVKASNTAASDAFGISVALSADGSTLAVGASGEDSNAVGIDGDQTNNVGTGSGAVYAFVRDGLGQWSQQAYIKASNTEANDQFGENLALSGDGNTLAVGARGEDSVATGIGGDQTSNLAAGAGAVYVFARDGLGAWSQQAYVKASNTALGDDFGGSVVLSSDASTLAVGAVGEDSVDVGVNPSQANNSASSAGAVYVFVSDGLGGWSQQAYVKASNTAANDLFGGSVALSAFGDVLAVGATGENGGSHGINGNQHSNDSLGSGAAYVLTRNAMGTWSQRAYVKASNTANDLFATAVALSLDGDTLAVSAADEDSNATGIGGDQINNSATDSGAVYLY